MVTVELIIEVNSERESDIRNFFANLHLDNQIGRIKLIIDNKIKLDTYGSNKNKSRKKGD